MVAFWNTNRYKIIVLVRNVMAKLHYRRMVFVKKILNNSIAINLYNDYSELFDNLNDVYTYTRHIHSSTKTGVINFPFFFISIKDIIKLVDKNGTVSFYLNELKQIIDALQYEKNILYNYFFKPVKNNLKVWYINPIDFFMFLNNVIEINKKISKNQNDDDFIIFIQFLRNIYFHFELNWGFSKLSRVTKYIENNYGTSIWTDIFSTTTKQQFNRKKVVYKNQELNLIDTFDVKKPILFQMIKWVPTNFSNTKEFSGFNLQIKGNFINTNETMVNWDLKLHYSDVYDIFLICNKKLLEYFKITIEKSNEIKNKND